MLEQQRKWSLANQIMRASLSIGANAKEAQNAESKADFIHKMKIAAKEADEVEFIWKYVTQQLNYRMQLTYWTKFNRSIGY